jgi:integrase
VDLVNCTARVRAVVAKGKRTRYAPLSTDIVRLLSTMQEELKTDKVVPIKGVLPIPKKVDGKALVFGNQKGKVNENIKRQWRETLKKVKAACEKEEVPYTLKGFRFHDLRQLFASRYLAAGGSLAFLREFLGHRGYETTLRHSHLAQAHIVEEVQRLVRPEGVWNFSGTFPSDEKKPTLEGGSNSLNSQ